jgi:diadenosine tetraphosphatase ApaH/serine/threonine PP2A family protein phosphatase
MKVLVLSDIHANLVALDAVLAAAPPFDAIWNLGDTVGYGPRPTQCLDRLSELPTTVMLVGNHDFAAIGALPLSTFNPLAANAARWTERQLRPKDISLFQSLPASAIAAGVTLAHGSPRDPIWEYVTDEETAIANFSHFATDLCLIGHSHVALAATTGDNPLAINMQLLSNGQIIDLTHGRFLINPGSVGQPRDRDPRAAFALLDTTAMSLSAHRVAYDIAATQRQMAEAGLPASLATRLARGV